MCHRTAPLNKKMEEMQIRFITTQMHLTEERRKNKVLRSHIRRRTDEWRREKEQRKKAEARGPVDPTNMTFMGFPVADHVEAMFVAEELCRAIEPCNASGNINEIAERFLKLRTPPTPKKVIRLEKFVCPECYRLAGEESEGGRVTHYFCENDECQWRCEA